MIGGGFVKKVFVFIWGIITGVAAVMLFLHRDAITASLTGEEMPEAPECCPLSNID